MRRHRDGMPSGHRSATASIDTTWRKQTGGIRRCRPRDKEICPTKIGRSTRRSDEASGGHDDPAAIRLLADRIDTTQPGDDVALVDLDDAHAALDQGGAAPDIAHHPAVEPARAR